MHEQTVLCHLVTLPKPGLWSWSKLVLGRPASGESFDRGACTQRLRIRRDGRPLLYEQLRLEAGDRLSNSRLGLGGASTVGTAVFTASPERTVLEQWLDSVNGPSLAGAFSVSQRDSLLIARYLGDDAFVGRAGFASLWRTVTEIRDGTPPSEPRIWHT